MNKVWCEQSEEQKGDMADGGGVGGGSRVKN